MDAYYELAYSYDRLTNDVDYRAVVDFYFAILEKEGLRPKSAVDLACGTGSVALLLAQKGLRVTGVDLSEDMLCVASQKAQEMEHPPLFVCQPLQQLRPLLWTKRTYRPLKVALFQAFFFFLAPLFCDFA